MSEVIQNKDSFLDKLKKLVIRENKELVKANPNYEQYIEQEIQKMLKERDKFVAVTTPEEEKKFRNEVKRSISSAIASKEAENNKDNEKDAEEKKDEIQDKKSKAKEDKSVKARDINSKQLGYLDRLELLHQMKMNMLKEQLKKDDYVPSDKEYYKMLLFQKSIENDREDYLKELDEKTRAEVVKVEEEYIGKELNIERRSNQKFREELAEFGRLNTQIREINEWIEEKQQEMSRGEVNPDEYQKQMKEKQLELGDALEKISALNPQKLQAVCDTKTKHLRLERGIMGENYRAKVYERSSGEMKERLDYRTGKENLQAAITKTENRFWDKNGIEKTIRDFEKHRKELEKELEKLDEKECTPENMKRKAELLKELRIVDARLDGAENKKEDLEQGMEENKNVEAKLAIEDKTIEEDVKEIEQEFVEVDKNIDKMDKDIDTAAIQGKSEEEIRKEAIETGAVVGGAVSLAGGTITQSAIAGAVAAEVKEEHESSKLRNEWESMVNSTPDDEAVKRHQETQEALRQIEEQEDIYVRDRTRRN